MYKLPTDRPPTRDEIAERDNTFDLAAVHARKELMLHIEDWTAKDLCKWWHKHYMEAGYKRLGRVLKEIGKGDGL